MPFSSGADYFFTMVGSGLDGGGEGGGGGWGRGIEGYWRGGDWRFNKCTLVFVGQMSTFSHTLSLRFRVLEIVFLSPGLIMQFHLIFHQSILPSFDFE